ncbi:MAG: ABC transporter permease [Dehalococcoidales bacterium]|nr:ABC transporter permease [Dehalococcoidales bacterium]
MTAYIIRRLFQAFIIVVLVTMLVFIAMRLMPGDPLLFYLSQDNLTMFSEEKLQALRHEYGLDKPIILQYTDWISRMFQGDFGISISNRRPVLYEISKTLPVTLYLGVISFVIGNILGIGAGIICAVRRGKVIDFIVTTMANFGITVPVFWLAIVMIYVFGLKLGWLPTHGFVWPTVNPWLSFKQSILPVICLAIGPLGGMARQTRSVMLEVVRQDYVRTAYAKGLTENDVIRRHVIKNGFIPLAILLGMGVTGILGGSVIVETVFNIAGMGRLAVNAVMGLDYPVTQAITLISAVMVVLSNLIVDISYAWLDPRVAYS